MLAYKPKAPQALIDGYYLARDKAVRRKEQDEEAGDDAEVKAWEKIRSYCEMMATCKFVDEPETLMNYVPLNENILDKRMLGEIMNDAEDGTERGWTKYHQMALDAAIAMLSPMERVVAEMHYAAQVKRYEIAEMLGKPVRTIDKHIVNINKKWAKLRD